MEQERFPDRAGEKVSEKQTIITQKVIKRIMHCLICISFFVHYGYFSFLADI